LENLNFKVKQITSNFVRALNAGASPKTWWFRSPRSVVGRELRSHNLALD